MVLDVGFVNERNTRKDALDLLLDAAAPLFKYRLELCTFACARRAEVAQRLANQFQRLVGERLRRERRFRKHARPAQDFEATDNGVLPGA